MIVKIFEIILSLLSLEKFRCPEDEASWTEETWQVGTSSWSWWWSSAWSWWWMIMIMFMRKHKLTIRKGTKGCKVQGAICKVVNLYYCHQIIASNVIKIFVKLLSSQVRMREVQGAICIASIVQLVIGYTGVCIVVYTFVCIIVYTSVCIIGYTGVCIILVHICLYYCLHRCLHFFALLGTQLFAS